MARKTRLVDLGEPCWLGRRFDDVLRSITVVPGQPIGIAGRSRAAAVPPAPHCVERVDHMWLPLLGDVINSLTGIWPACLFFKKEVCALVSTISGTSTSPSRKNL